MPGQIPSWFNWCCVLLFVSRAWQFIRWSPPLRAFFWDQSLLEPFVTNVLGMTWHEWATSSVVDARIDAFAQILGVVFIVCGIASIPYNTIFQRFRLWRIGVIWVGAFLLFLLAVLQWKEYFYRPVNLAEYVLQWFTPLLLGWILYRKQITNLQIVVARLAVALTFLGHGLYALNIFPVPGYWIDMVLTLTWFNEDGARVLLLCAGVWDLVIAVGVVFLWKHKFVVWILYWAVFWGFCTAMARFSWGVMITPSFIGAVSEWLYQSLVRLPHAVVPLFLIRQWIKNNAQNQCKDLTLK